MTQSLLPTSFEASDLEAIIIQKVLQHPGINRGELAMHLSQAKNISQDTVFASIMSLLRDHIITSMCGNLYPEQGLSIDGRIVSVGGL